MSLETDARLKHLAKRVDDLEATVKRLMDGVSDHEPRPLARIMELAESLSKYLKLD